MLPRLVHITGRPQHGNSEEQKQSIRPELLQRASWLQKEKEKKAEVADKVLVQAFAAFYFITKEEISNMFCCLQNFLLSLG